MSDDRALGGLPDDSDIEVDDRPVGRLVHLRSRFLALVFLGGALGTAAREGLSLAFPAGDGIPYAIFGINVLGAFLLGLLLEALVRRGADHGGRRAVRLFFGTGVLGGFTTYSALATDAAALIGRGEVLAGVGYGVVTVLIGAVATFAGIAVGAATHRAEAR